VQAPNTPAPEAEHLAMLDELTTGLLDSLGLQDRLDAILRFFVPAFANGAAITIEDENGQMRTVSRGPVPRNAPVLAMLLQTGDGCIGTLQLDLTQRGETIERRLLEKLTERIARALEHSLAFEREQRASLAFQYAALTTKLPDVPGLRLDAVYQAGRAEALIGGDWYDAFTLPDGRLIVSTGDVVGSGLRAAVAMVSVRQSLRTIAHLQPDPELMLDAANRTLCDEFPDRYVTTFLAVIDPVTQLCAYVNAGHPPPFLRLSNGDVIQLPCGGLPLGLAGFAVSFKVRHLTLPTGSMLLLYTDGLTEATRNVVEGEESLRAALASVDPQRIDAADLVYHAVLGRRARDDVAILTVAMQGATNVKRWRFDPHWSDVTTRARGEIASELRDAGMCAGALFRFEAIFAELVANIVRHAPGTAEFLLQRQADAFVLHVLDAGPGFRISPRLPNDLFSERGRGLYLIFKLADGFSVDRRPGGGSHARVTLCIPKGAHT
jgi:serine phosphatase RsbU (regulator of sigma subunit)/anti-sigma regulatory factor (Ser/Thr protein kinase)